jgi:hypothetical protein
MRSTKFKLLVAVAFVMPPMALHAEAPVGAESKVSSLDTNPGSSLEESFRDPPETARPRVWWHWMNGNITKDGIAKDIEWMKRVGIGGLQNFDVDLGTKQIVENRLAYMTPEWKDAFRFAASEAQRQGLEFAIASSPGWSETGGPWVRPEDAQKKVVWSEALVTSGKSGRIRLVAPPSNPGPFQGIEQQPDLSELLAGGHAKCGPDFYRDIAVLAVPVGRSDTLPVPTLTDGLGRVLKAGGQGALVSNVVLGPVVGPTAPEFRLDYGKPVTIRSATIYIPGGTIPPLPAFYGPRLETSDDGMEWRSVTAFSLAEVPTTVSFPQTTARYFRVIIKPAFPMGGTPTDDNGVAMENEFGKLIGGRLSQPVTIGSFELSGEARVDQFEAKAGFAVAADYYALPAIADGAKGPSPTQVLDLTDKLGADGTLNWVPPKGTWRIVRLGYSLIGKTNHPAPAEATGLETDKYDGGAVERYLTRYLDGYKSAAGDDLVGRRGVRALLTDSIEVGAANWTPRMKDQFMRLRGYDPTPWLPALAGVIIGNREETDRFLYDYRRTLGDLLVSEHYATVAKVAHANGMKVYGEALESNRINLGDDMAMRRYTDYPMAAMWTFDRRTGPEAAYVADIKGASSVAHIFGQNIVAAESMTVNMSPWAFAPADLKHVVDLEFVLGVNRPVVHTSAHVPVDDKLPGLSLAGIGQFFNRNESWAELARPWVDYMARNSLLLQEGRNVADVGYFYGEEGPLIALYGHSPVADAPKNNAFDFVSVDALTTALQTEGGEVVAVGGARYRALYLGGSSRRMTLGTLRKIAQLVESGATVIGVRPEGTPSMSDDRAAFNVLLDKLWPGSPATSLGKGRVIASGDVDAALKEIGVAPDFRFTGGAADTQIPFVHRALADGDSYFLVNRKDRDETVEAHFRVTGKAPELWDAHTGTRRPVSYRIVEGETIVPLSLRAEESVHVVFRKPTQLSTFTVPERPTRQLASLSDGWKVAFQKDRGAPGEIAMGTLEPLNENKDAGVRYFSGLATYSRSFSAPRDWKPGEDLTLDLGEVREIAEVHVNGKFAGYSWHKPYRVEVGKLVRRGRNTLDIRVANLWVNRLIRDADPNVEPKVTWTELRTYRPDAKLRPSGLIGPVKLESAER